MTAAVVLSSGAGARAAEPYVAKVYKPTSKRDLTGIWQSKDGSGWEPGVRTGTIPNPPLTPDYRAIYDRHRANSAAGRPSGDPTATCLQPQGMPRFMTATNPMEIVQNDIQVNFYAEWNEQSRRIFIDGRPHPPADELDPSFNGDSIGHWQGDVLVAETVGLRPDSNLESSGMPHSDALVVKERIWLADDDNLRDEITLVDPKAYTGPWTVTKTYYRADPSIRILPYRCENQRNPVDESGAIGFTFKNSGGVEK